MVGAVWLERPDLMVTPRSARKPGGPADWSDVKITARHAATLRRCREREVAAAVDRGELDGWLMAGELWVDERQIGVLPETRSDPPAPVATPPVKDAVPPGWLTLREWADREGVGYPAAHRAVRYVEAVKVGWEWRIAPTATVPRR